MMQLPARRAAPQPILIVRPHRELCHRFAKSKASEDAICL
jgi:hypothetical protein